MWPFQRLLVTSNQGIKSLLWITWICVFRFSCIPSVHGRIGRKSSQRIPSQVLWLQKMMSIKCPVPTPVEEPNKTKKHIFEMAKLHSKKSPTGPTERTPKKPEYLIARSQLTERGLLVRSHSIFVGFLVVVSILLIWVFPKIGVPNNHGFSY